MVCVIPIKSSKLIRKKIHQIAVCLFFAFTCSNSYAQNRAEGKIDKTSTSKEFRDSIINKYVKGIGQYYTFYSGGWQGILDTALSYLPHDAYLWQLKAMAYFKRQKYEVGTPYLDSAVKYDADRYIDYRAFMKCIFQKNYVEAIKDFNASKQLKGEDGIVMDHSYNFYIGVAYLQLNKFDSAQKYLMTDFSNIVENRGEDWVPYLTPFYLGISLYEQKKIDSALIYLNKAIKIYPRFSDGKCYKAICLYNQNHFSEALDLMAEAVRDNEHGYTINDANTKYEWYPYQVDKELMELYIEKITLVSETYKTYEKEEK